MPIAYLYHEESQRPHRPRKGVRNDNNKTSQAGAHLHSFWKLATMWDSFWGSSHNSWPDRIFHQQDGKKRPTLSCQPGSYGIILPYWGNSIQPEFAKMYSVFKNSVSGGAFEHLPWTLLQYASSLYIVQDVCQRAARTPKIWKIVVSSLYTTSYSRAKSWKFLSLIRATRRVDGLMKRNNAQLSQYATLLHHRQSGLARKMH